MTVEDHTTAAMIRRLCGKTAGNAVVIWGPPACGKTYHAQAFAAEFGCTMIVDEWHPSAPLIADALHLTTQKPLRYHGTLHNAPVYDFAVALAVINSRGHRALTCDVPHAFAVIARKPEAPRPVTAPTAHDAAILAMVGGSPELDPDFAHLMTAATALDPRLQPPPPTDGFASAKMTRAEAEADLARLRADQAAEVNRQGRGCVGWLRSGEDW